ncbi:hypothetical protein GJAV_G00228050 [Gymnothorax javanicus]|nr:hypothetical protein GJAV_G00228050 [Gymnothorax javanicus]
MGRTIPPLRPAPMRPLRMNGPPGPPHLPGSLAGEVPTMRRPQKRVSRFVAPTILCGPYLKQQKASRPIPGSTLPPLTPAQLEMAGLGWPNSQKLSMAPLGL